MRKRVEGLFKIVVAVLALSVLLQPAARLSAAAPRPPLRVVATTTVFADLVRNVGGERVEAHAIIPMGGDPHTYDPTPAQVRQVAAADILFYNGLGLELFADRLIHNTAQRGLKAVRLSEGLAPIHGASFAVEGHGHGRGEHSHEDGDPHFWLNVRHAMHYVERIRDALIEMDPEGAEVYAERSGRYLAELAALDEWIAGRIGSIPEGNRLLVTYHDAFAYFAQAYELELVGVLVRNPDREPSAQEMARLVRSIRELGVRAVFAEPHINPRFAQSLAQEAGVSVHVLLSDSLMPEAPTYVDMMKLNAERLVAALQ